jgi:protocatechuate 3,4-dioxygenase beta subunit
MRSALKILLLTAICPQLSFSQNENAALQQVNKQLSSKERSVTDILQDPAYMNLHSLTTFREIIKKNAKQEKITLVNKNEPGNGVRITVKLVSNNRPVNGLLVYVYHTDNRGWYSDTAAHVLAYEGDRGHARLFGYLLSDKEGNIEFTTIHPQGYPNSTLPQHIHLEVFDKNGTNLAVTELLFDDDDRLKGTTRNRALQEGFVIAKNEGNDKNQHYSYVVTLR